MGKRKTLLTVILCVVLAALVCAAAVLGAALSRSTYSDTDNAYAVEARWKITEKTGEEILDVTVFTEKIRPDYTEYDAMTKTARTKEFFGAVAAIENDGDVKASVAVKAGSPELVFDGCGNDDERYGEKEVWEHISCEMYFSTNPSLTPNGVTDDGKAEASPFDLKPDESLYIYVLAVWTTDLGADIDNVNREYDGVYGDDFDTWAGQHLLGISYLLDIECAQAE